MQLKLLKEKKLKLDDEDKKDILDSIVEDLDEAINSNPDLEETINGYDKLAAGDLPEKTEPWNGCSNINHPMIRIAISGGVARWMKQLLGRGKMMVAKPGTDEQNKLAPRIETVIDFLMRTEIKLKRTIRRLVKKVAKHGTAIAHPYWVEEKEIVKDVKIYKGDNALMDFKEDFPSAEEGGMEEKEYRAYLRDLEKEPETGIEIPVEYEDYKFRGVRVDIIDRRDFIIHKDIIDPEKAKVKGQRFWQSWYEIVARYESGEYGEDNGGESLEALKAKLGGEKDDKEEKNPDYTKKRLECVKAIYKYDVDDCKKKEEALLITIIKDEESGVEYLLRCENYGFWHGRDFFIPFRIDEGDGFDGEGFAEKLWDINLYANAAHNQRIDRGTIANIPFFKGRKGADVEESRLELAKGIVYWLEHPDDFEQVRIQGAPITDLIAEEQMLERMGELTTKITTSATGKESATDPRAPATKTLALLQQQDIGISDYIDCLDPSFAELAYQILSLYYEFGFNDEEEGEGTVIRELTGDKYKFEPLTRQELKIKGMEFGLRCSTTGMNELVEEAKFKEIAGLLIQTPEIMQDRVRFWNVIREMVDRSGLEISSDILPTPEQMEKENLKRIKQALRELVKERMQGISEEARGEIEKRFQMLFQILGLGGTPPVAGATPPTPTGGAGAEITGPKLPEEVGAV